MKNNRNIKYNLDFIPEYQKARKEGWHANAKLWDFYVNESSNRQRLYLWVIDQLIDIMGSEWNPNKVIDFGCGEGSFLRHVNKRYSCVNIQGIDYSKDMLELAKLKSFKGNEIWTYGDFESDNFTIKPDYDLAAAILTLVEVKNLGNSIKNITASLKKSGIAVILILDPTIELYRNGLIEPLPKNILLNNFQKEIIIEKHFWTKDGYSINTYFNIIRRFVDYWKIITMTGLNIFDIRSIFMKDSFLKHSSASLYDLLLLNK